MFFATLEIDTGEFLDIIRPDGHSAGKNLLNFIDAYSVYKDRGEDNMKEYEWFNKFEKLSTIEISPIKNILYSGDWDYGEDEYERFLEYTEYNPFKNKEEFIDGIKAIADMWIPIDTVITIVEEIIRIFSEFKEETYWYSPVETKLEFQGILNTLLLAKKGKGKKVRIKID